jgi:hypothetical protein
VREAAAPARASRLSGSAVGAEAARQRRRRPSQRTGKGRKTDVFGALIPIDGFDHTNPRTLLANPPLGECNSELPPF